MALNRDNRTQAAYQLYSAGLIADLTVVSREVGRNARGSKHRSKKYHYKYLLAYLGLRIDDKGDLHEVDIDKGLFTNYYERVVVGGMRYPENGHVDEPSQQSQAGQSQAGHSQAGWQQSQAGGQQSQAGGQQSQGGGQQSGAGQRRRKESSGCCCCM